MRAVDHFVLSRTVFHALIYDSEVPATKEESKRKKTPESVWQSILDYKQFRSRHDAEWQTAQDHPIRLYEFLGLSVEGLSEYLGEPPEPSPEEKEAQSSRQRGREAVRQEIAAREERLLASLRSSSEASPG